MLHDKIKIVFYIILKIITKIKNCEKWLWIRSPLFAEKSELRFSTKYTYSPKMQGCFSLAELVSRY